MEIHVKERIVGAAVLVALGVWLIPWVLDGPEEGETVETETGAGLTLPGASDSAPVRTETVSLAPEPVRATRSGSDDAAGADLTAGSATVPGQTDDTPSAVATDAPEPVAAASPPAVAAAAPSEPPQSAAPPPAAEPAGWMLQLGAFSELAGARQVANGVRDFGFTAFVSEHRDGGRTLHRVRIGGFETRAAAEAARSSLMAHGYQPQVVAPE